MQASTPALHVKVLQQREDGLGFPLRTAWFPHTVMLAAVAYYKTPIRK